MIEIKIPSNKEINITKNEYNTILNYLTTKQEKIGTITDIDAFTVTIKTATQNYIFKRKKGMIEEIICIPNFLKKPSQKKPGHYKTKKGNLLNKGILTLALSGTMIVVASMATKTLPKETYNPIVTETTEQTEDVDDIVVQLENPMIQTETPVIQEETSKTKAIEMEEITNVLNYEVVQSNRMGKRKETHDLFGSTITYYASQFGIDVNVAEALITQERHDQEFSNLGQLTRQICGEEIMIPIIEPTKEEKENQQEVKKIYIVRDKPNPSNFQSEEKYQNQLNLYREQLEKSKQLASKGYEIIYFENLLGEKNCDENIRISILWFAHCIYKCGNKPNSGLRSYNSGYTKVKKATDREIMNAEIGKESSDPYYNYHVYQFLSKEEAQKITFILRPFPDNWSQMTQKEQEDYLENQISTAPYVKTTIELPLFIESKEDTYQYEEKVGHNL